MTDVEEKKRSYYIDNLRWMIILLLIPYHTAQAWNTWGEANYIYFHANKLISSIIVFLSPYIMPIMFVLAGISTRYALQKRSCREYISERVKRLVVPLIFGTIVFMPIMTYIADCFNYSYKGTFIHHYLIFFSKYTDLIGADGGFSLGQFWFLLYLFLISIVGVGIIYFVKKDIKKTVPLWVVVVLGLPLPILNGLLSCYRWLFLSVGLVAAFVNVYLFIWSGKEYSVLITVIRFVTEWIMILASLGVGKKMLNQTVSISRYLSSRSFLFFSFHFIWVVVFQYALYQIFESKTVILFCGTIVLSYMATFICCEIAIRIPLLRYLMGIKNSKVVK